jgi:N-formylglutamate deformylase
VVDFALGDRFGRSCSAAVIEAAEAILRSRGFTVARNRPYAGGHITASYGCPEADIHALQIEVRRGLYMDEHTLMPHAALDDLRVVVRDLLVELGRFVVEELTPRTPGATVSLPALPAGA